MRTTKDYLTDIQAYIIRIEHTTRAGEDAFYSDFTIQDAVIRQYEVIGEIIKRLPETVLNTQPHINWKGFKGFRDFLAHNYDRVDLVVIWETVLQLPTLRQAIESLLADLQDDPEE